MSEVQTEKQAKEHKKPALTYRGDIDGLRAISIILVIIVHSIKIGDHSRTVGVDIFFVISGYLITTIILKEHKKGTFTFAKFYTRRVKRIFPILFISIATYLIITYVFHNELMWYIGGHANWSLFMSFNLLVVRNRFFPPVRIPDNRHYSIFLPHWTLGIEEQFYIVWPLVLVLALRKKNQNLFRNVGIAAMLSFILMTGLVIGKQVAVSAYLSLSRCWELLCGCMFAISEFNKGSAQDKEELKLNTSQNVKIQNSNMSLDVTSTSAAPVEHEIKMDFKEFTYCFINVFILASALLRNSQVCERAFFVLWTIFIIKNKNTYFNQYILGSKIMIFIGKASYSIYLWHYGMITLIRNDNLWVAVCTGLFGILMYPVESKIRKSSHPFIIPGIAIFGLILFACCIATQL